MLTAKYLPNRAVLLKVIEVDGRVPAGNHFVLLLRPVVVAPVPLLAWKGLQVVRSEDDRFAKAVIWRKRALVVADSVYDCWVWHYALVFEARVVELL